MMKIITDPDGTPVIKEVFSGAYIETEEGNRVGFCLRDDTIEFNVMPAGGGRSQWFRIDMQTLEVRKEKCRVIPISVVGQTPAGEPSG